MTNKVYLGVGETRSIYLKSSEVCWYVSIYITQWYVHVPKSVQKIVYQHIPRYMHVPNRLELWLSTPPLFVAIE